MEKIKDYTELHCQTHHHTHTRESHYHHHTRAELHTHKTNKTNIYIHTPLIHTSSFTLQAYTSAGPGPGGGDHDEDARTDATTPPRDTNEKHK